MKQQVTELAQALRRMERALETQAQHIQQERGQDPNAPNPAQEPPPPAQPTQEDADMNLEGGEDGSRTPGNRRRERSE